jgi:intraflagellar transport protein 172
VSTASSIVAAGCDKRVIFYADTGRIVQQFDFSRDDEYEFACAVADPSGRSVVIGSFDR